MIEESTLSEIIEFSKHLLSKKINNNCAFETVSFLIKQDGSFSLKASLPIDDLSNTLFRVGMITHRERYKKLIVVSDVYISKAPNKKAFLDLLDNWDTENPFTYPEKMRQDSLFFMLIDLSEKQEDSVEGISISYKKENKTVVFDEPTRIKSIGWENAISPVMSGFVKSLLSELVIYQLGLGSSKDEALLNASIEFKRIILDDYPLIATTELYERLPDNDIVMEIVDEEIN